MMTKLVHNKNTKGIEETKIEMIKEWIEMVWWHYKDKSLK